MSDSHTRYVKIDDWYFELKTVRALRVDEYGEPYSAIANCNINGDKMYVDGLLTKEDKDFTREDFMTFLKFAKQLGLDGFSYHRFHDGKSINRDVKVDLLEMQENKEKKVEPQERIRLVK